MAQLLDPLGLLIFSLAIHKLVFSVEFSLNICAQVLDVEASDVESLLGKLRNYELTVNTSKCELFSIDATATTHLPTFEALI